MFEKVDINTEYSILNPDKEPDRSILYVSEQINGRKKMGMWITYEKYLILKNSGEAYYNDPRYDRRHFYDEEGNELPWDEASLKYWNRINNHNNQKLDNLQGDDKIINEYKKLQSMSIIDTNYYGCFHKRIWKWILFGGIITYIFTCGYLVWAFIVPYIINGLSKEDLIDRGLEIRGEYRWRVEMMEKDKTRTS